jgi:hypothetical protein
MLHRIVSRSVVVLAGTAFLASCEDNTTGTPLTPPPASTAVYVNPVVPEDGYSTEQVTITIPAVGEIPAHDTVVTAVTPNPEFEVTYPDGDPAVDQVITFNLNLPGLIEQSKDTVPASGLVTPGRWIVAEPCPPSEDFCRPTQRIIATPVAGNAGVIDVSVDTATVVPPPSLRASR